MAGSVVTFYSYKGGVGRSFALANIAVILAQWGYRILLVDWDIEAPGLNHYFAPYVTEMPAGVLDFLNDCKGGRPSEWRTYTTTITLPGVDQSLQLMPAAGGGGTDYSALVQALDWDELYREYALGSRVEALRAAWLTEFDLVLLDSRTGITDFSGLTTAQLPDTLAFMFTANRQSLSGSCDIARRAMEARRRMPLDRPALLPLPIPARFEQREEYDRAQVWRKHFVTDLAPFLEVWAPRDVDHLKLIDCLTIPYVPRWTFGEELASLAESAGTTGTRAPSQSASYACETLAALLIQGFSKVDLLTSSRDEYVHGARSLAQHRRSAREGTTNVYISFSYLDRSLIDKMAASMKRGLDNRFQIFRPDKGVAGFGDISSQLQRQIERADAYIVVISPSFSESRWQQQETEWFLRESLRSQEAKTLIPVVLTGAEDVFNASRLRDYKALVIDPDANLDTQLSPIIERLRSTNS